ncbi:hypothetical protein CJD36_009375 [Flavipsychrobacter stenotrophus]|uniref:Uncharacterized protein n=1 Tax=Flavipsychrobacter stenotrophus TaxID=2077091 RepID=A0A2S7SYG6_9BACT|nr:hypothetical protein CJD36_009375 [Flavipsychrobacter stenotrophus]
MRYKLLIPPQLPVAIPIYRCPKDDDDMQVKDNTNKNFFMVQQFYTAMGGIEQGAKVINFANII